MPRCIYCGSNWHTEEDHVKAKIKGGQKTVEACRACNRSKGNKSLMDWLRWLKKNRKRRWRKVKEHNYRKKNPIAKRVHKVRYEK